MQQELPTGNMKDKFNKGPESAQILSPEQLEQQRKEQEENLDEVLPFFRKQAEYNRLQMELVETDALMGRIPIAQVTGLLGLELKVRETQAIGWLTQYMDGQKKAMEEHAQRQAAIHKDVVDQLLYSTSDDAGKVQAFIKNEQYDPQVHTMVVNTTDGRISYQIPCTTCGDKPYREISVTLGGMLIKDSKGEVYAVTPEQYNDAMEYKARQEFDKLSPEDQQRVQAEAIERYKQAQANAAN